MDRSSSAGTTSSDVTPYLDRLRASNINACRYGRAPAASITSRTGHPATTPTPSSAPSPSRPCCEPRRELSAPIRTVKAPAGDAEKDMTMPGPDGSAGASAQLTLTVDGDRLRIEMRGNDADGGLLADLSTSERLNSSALLVSASPPNSATSAAARPEPESGRRRYASRCWDGSATADDPDACGDGSLRDPVGEFLPLSASRARVVPGSCRSPLMVIGGIRRPRNDNKGPTQARDHLASLVGDRRGTGSPGHLLRNRSAWHQSRAGLRGRVRYLWEH